MKTETIGGVKYRKYSKRNTIIKAGGRVREREPKVHKPRMSDTVGSMLGMSLNRIYSARPDEVKVPQEPIRSLAEVLDLLDKCNM